MQVAAGCRCLFKTQKTHACQPVTIFLTLLADLE